MKRLVIKVGSAVLTEKDGLALERMQNLVQLIVELKQRYEVILVSSGAVAAGYTSLPLDKSNVANRQALAAIGQPLLMRHYKDRFRQFGVICSQMLLTADDFDSIKRTQHAKNAIEVLLSHHSLPIINENDVTATEELVFGDNDQLAAHTAYKFDADLLVILSDIQGYYSDNPKTNPDAKLLKVVDTIEPVALQAEHTPGHAFATGGIVTKLKAADFLLQNGKSMFLSSGFDLTNVRNFLLNDQHIGGTLFTPAN